MEFNSHAYAISIEFVICSIRPDLISKADAIERDPVGFLDQTCLDILEMKSEESKIRVCDFWDKYEKHKGKHMKDLGEDLAKELVHDVRELFKCKSGDK